MSNAEHLIENAICDFEENGSFECFLSSEHNRRMAKAVGISLEDVESMAIHIIYAFKEDWIEQGRQEMIGKYGYALPEE